MMSRDEALKRYARLGFATIPLRPREKRPLRKGWRVPDSACWADVPPDVNVGVLTGTASGGLVVLDFDHADGPFDVLGLRPRELARQTLVVQTARGWHAYFRSSDLRTRSPIPGLDIRGEGAMVVAPPSVHPSGHRYAFVGEPREPAVLESLLPDPVGVGAAVAASPDAAIDWAEIDAWISLQAPKLQEAWRYLREPPARFDRSRADFAVARCLWEAGHPEDLVVRVLLALPGSKARERGEAYAVRTVRRAAEARGTTRCDPRD